MRFSSGVEHIAEVSRDEAMRTGHYGICADHLMLAILRLEDAGAADLLASLGIDREALKDAIDEGLFLPTPVPYGRGSEVRYSESALSAFNLAALEAMKCGSEVVSPEHLVAGICRCAGSVTAEWMRKGGADAARVSVKLREMFPAASVETTPAASEIAEEIARELESVQFMPSGSKIVS